MTYTTLKGGDKLAWSYWAFQRHKFSKFLSANVPHFKKTHFVTSSTKKCPVLLRKTNLIRKFKQLLTETGMVATSYFDNRKQKVSKSLLGVV